MSERTRYFLQENDAPEREVDRATSAEAERAAGFHPKPGLRTSDGRIPLATGGFTKTGPRGAVRGRVETVRD
jgi:hypothetical protein